MPLPPQADTATQNDAKPVNVSRVFLGYLADIVLPMVLYFVLHRLGFSDLAALAAGIAVALIATIANTVRRGKIDRVGIIVLLEIALSIAFFSFSKIAASFSPNLRSTRRSPALIDRNLVSAAALLPTNP